MAQKHDTMTMLEYEQICISDGKKYIAGVDEVGRGPLAGPVVVACVIMPIKDKDIILGVNDSKKLSEAKREELYEKIIRKAICINISRADEKVIDTINILQATKNTMKDAINNMKINPDLVLIDALKLDNNCPSMSIIKGDTKSYNIACASIVAKVTRDKLMKEYDMLYPMYGFASNKGYGTAVHINAIKQFGACNIHRKTFIKNFLHEQ